MAGYKRQGARPGTSRSGSGVRGSRAGWQGASSRDDDDDEQAEPRERGSRRSGRSDGGRQSRRAVEPEDAGAETLLDLCGELFSVVIHLRQGGQPPDVAALQHELLRLLDRIKARASHIGISSTEVDHARYALAALLDETVLHGALEGKEAWIAEPLQMQLFGENTAGEGFFARLEQLRRIKGSEPVLEVYYLCLALGFEGRYRMASGTDLVALREELGREIAPRKRGPRMLSPHGDRPDAAMHAPRRLPLYLLAGGGALLIMALLMLLSRLTAKDAASVGAELGASVPTRGTRGW